MQLRSEWGWMRGHTGPRPGSGIGRATHNALAKFLDLFPTPSRRETTVSRGNDAVHRRPSSPRPLVGITRSRPIRVALYSHDTVGLGHMRRNLLIARTLARSELQPVILMIAGGREAGLFTIPPGVDCLTLPALQKDAGGHYRSRHLNVSLSHLIALRARTIRAVLEEFEPDALIVDKVPRGAVRELDPSLEVLHERGRTRCILGLRDVLDQADAVHREWSSDSNDSAVRNYYDAVWVYGDPLVYDPVREYHFPADVAAKVRYTGYLGQRPSTTHPDGRPDSLPRVPKGRLILCLVGGGQDGAHLSKAFAEAHLPPGTFGVILTGLFMPKELQMHIERSATSNPRVSVQGFVPDPDALLSRAERVVAMGGYNTVCEVLSLEKHALIVPRVNPRREQLIRAERMRDLGLLDVLHPDKLSPHALTHWLARPNGTPPRPRDLIDMDGLERLPGLLEEALCNSTRTAGSPTPEGVPHHAAG
jgi:predicted glycosyltransferase